MSSFGRIIIVEITSKQAVKKQLAQKMTVVEHS